MWLFKKTLQINASDIGTYSGEATPDEPASINLMVVNTARSQAEKVARSEAIMLVVDECHRVGSRENARVLGARTRPLSVSLLPRAENTMTPSIQSSNLRWVQLSMSMATMRRDETIVISSFELINVAVEMSSTNKIVTTS